MSSLRLADRAEAPYYLPIGNEIDLFRACHEQPLPVPLKALKPSTRQRFVALEFDFPSPAREAEIVEHESGVPRATARALTELAVQIRRLRDQGLAEGPGTRLLVSVGRLIARGIPARE